MQQRLPELQPERGGGERGPPEGHPDLEGASHRHLQVRTGEGEAEEQIHPPEGAWGPAWGACPPGVPGPAKTLAHTRECKGWRWGNLG